jgi:hypothetical protein
MTNTNLWRYTNSYLVKNLPLNPKQHWVTSLDHPTNNNVEAAKKILLRYFKMQPNFADLSITVTVTKAWVRPT